MARVTLYTAGACPYCVQAKRLLGERRIAYEEIDVGTDETRRSEMIERTGGRRTVPQIFIDERHVGGYADLRLLADGGGLDPLV